MTIKQNYDYLKRKHYNGDDEPILLMRCGDFYETFNNDAKAVADICGLVLTKQSDYHMAGFPAHSLDTYLPKLVRAGKRIAICDYTKDIKQ
jgi:DNA mismatch repair protein MutS